MGFIHGVMNTDNMSISGETIDYGPCAFMEHYDPATVFSSIDTQGRYAYGNQPRIAQWNLARLAETLLPLLDADSDRAITRATDVIQAFPELYPPLAQGMRAKLGLVSEDEADLDLATGFLSAMEGQNVDYTLAFRYLAEAASGEDDRFARCLPMRRPMISGVNAGRRGFARGGGAGTGAGHAAVNPAFIPRNHRVEEALSAAVERDDYAPFATLLKILARPFDDQPEFAAFAEPAPKGKGTTEPSEVPESCVRVTQKKFHQYCKKQFLLVANG